jgi:membrane protein
VIRPLRASLRVAWRAFLRFQDHHGPDRAAAVAYYTLLSLVPLLIFLISLGMAVLGSFDAAFQGSMLLVRGVVIHLSPASVDALKTFVTQASRFHWPGLLLLAWTSRRIFASLFSALETVFGVPGRSFAKHNLVALSMVLVTGMALLFTMAFTMLSATSEGLMLRMRASGELHSLSLLVSRVVPLAVTYAFFFLVYRFVPRKATNRRLAAIGALLATTMWELAKSAFAYYIRNVAQYSGIYGTLEGIIVLALWLELSVSIILYCGEVVALLIHHQAAARVPLAADLPPAGIGGPAATL